VYYVGRDGRSVITSRIRSNEMIHTREAVEETVECASSRSTKFTVNVTSREPAQAAQLPKIVLPFRVEAVQFKEFTWTDESYSHTVQSHKKSEWRLSVEMVWHGESLLEVDALMSSRRPPHVRVSMETGAVDQVVKDHVAGEMTLLTSAGIYAMSAICMHPKERDEWVWTLLA
jgi:hypothetical protein